MGVKIRVSRQKAISWHLLEWNAWISISASKKY